MTARAVQFMGVGLPYLHAGEVEGRLVVVEGTDGVGRTTHLALLREWLEVQGFAVMETGWTRSQLVGKTIGIAKQGHRLSQWTHSLLYATDFADRLEREIIPALRAGYIVLADRYVYTAFARGESRVVDAAYLRNLLGFAIVPDLTFYLRVDLATLTHRVLSLGPLDYWEAGKDLYPEKDFFESFQLYQGRLIEKYDRMAEEHAFQVVDARLPVDRTQTILRSQVARLIGARLPDVD